MDNTGPNITHEIKKPCCQHQQKLGQNGLKRVRMKHPNVLACVVIQESGRVLADRVGTQRGGRGELRGLGSPLP